MRQSARGMRLWGMVMLMVVAEIVPMPIALAGLTDLSSAPLVTQGSTVIKPNVLFILDDSGSMAWSHMPDTVKNLEGHVGYENHLCNPLYYNPNYTYPLPVDSTGTAFSNQSFTSAKSNGFNSGSSSVNLSTSFRAYDNTTGNTGSPDSAQPAYYYTFTGTGTPTGALGTSGSGQCYETASTSSPYNSTSFNRVVVSSTSGPGGTDERQNFANWYSFYRTRILMMKSAAGLAFKNIGNSYRVGFTTISYEGVDDSNADFLQIRDFGDGTSGSQKYNWYSKFYAATPGGSTPLRGALSKAGRIYAGQLLTGNNDPVQYSCQQNFTILSTDGYWNTNDETSSYGPYKVDNSTAVGNQDGALSRPYYDGSTISTPSTKTQISYLVTSSSCNSLYHVGTTTSCSGGKKQVLKITQTSTQTVTTDPGGNTLSSTGWSTPTTSACSIYTSCTNGNPTAPSSPSPTVVVGTSSTTGTSNSLADVAAYYYNTDLRPAGATGYNAVDVSEDNVTGAGADQASWQHMTLMTLGLGAPGKMQFNASYATAQSGDYFNVKSGTANPSSSVCNWSSPYNALCNWPTPQADTATAIDDLWHAAVDGHGSYFSATDPASLAQGLSSALSAVSARIGASAAAATSSPNITSTNNFEFSSNFTTVNWTGEFYRQQIDTTTGQASTTVDWVVSSCTPPATGLSLSPTACSNLLDAVPYANRKIYTYDPNNATAANSCDGSTANKLKCFQYSDLTSAEKAYFGTSVVSTLSQYSSLNAAQQTAAEGANLVNYLRGDTTNYSTSSSSPLYRARTHILGDIVTSAAAYEAAPALGYSDNGYATFVTNYASRQATVYVGSNDGMLHAFNANTGQEMWAYVPSFVLPNLYKLADYNYGSQHQYYVDGTPVVSDVCVNVTYNTSSGRYECNSANDWRTILVEGLNGGGKGYFALDVTDPTNPKALWEFTDTRMGYTYGNPVITKMPDGKWVVLVTSGYNNTYDGKGYLFALNAATGTNYNSASYPLATTNGTSATPSGLSRIGAWVTSPATDNTALRVYGGDLMGSLWRFDLAGTTGASVLDLADFQVGGVAQPITARPELASVGSSAVIYVGTGALLGTTDLSNTLQQSVYAIKDPLGATGYGDIRASGVLYPNTLNSTTTDANGQQIRTITNNQHQVNFATDAGWYLDFPAVPSGSGSERMNVDMQLALGTLVLNTNIPNSNACTAGGYSWQYHIDYRYGTAIDTSGGVAGVKLGNSLATQPTVIRLPNGTVVSVTQLGDGSKQTTGVPIGSGAGLVKRVFWRELMSQ